MKIKFCIISLLISLPCFVISQNVHAFSLFGSSSKSRDYIYIVGSSTISPLMATVSEEFARIKNMNNFGDDMYPTPIVESTGTGAGFEEFCHGKSLKYPDFVNASRAISQNEIYQCKKNKVTNIGKIRIGYDGIVLGNYIRSKTLRISKEQLFLALAKRVYDNKTNKLIPNPYRKWSDIDARLPNKKIKIYGPPKSSGTRDIFEELVMKDYCNNDMKLIQSYSNKEIFNKKCHEIREDNVFIDSGENDNLIITKLKSDYDSFGIFGYNFLAINKNVIQPAIIDSIKPTSKNISLKKYSLSRPLFVYFKIDNIKKVPAIKEFIAEIINNNTIGNKGYLIHSGLIPLSNNEYKKVLVETKNILKNN